MSGRRRIGVDVGGTNTDAALVDGTEVVASVKAPTTDDVIWAASPRPWPSCRPTTSARW